MKTIAELRTSLVRELKEGELFGHNLDGTVALCIALAANDSYRAVALTHPPGKQAVLPSLISKQFFEGDETVLCFDNVRLMVARQVKCLGARRDAIAGAIVFTAEGRFLRCERDSKVFDVNVGTWLLKPPSSHLPVYSATSWKIVGTEESEVIFEWPRPNAA
jgi:hypothetical protein